MTLNEITSRGQLIDLLISKHDLSKDEATKLADEMLSNSKHICWGRKKKPWFARKDPVSALLWPEWEPAYPPISN